MKGYHTSTNQRMKVLLFRLRSFQDMMSLWCLIFLFYSIDLLNAACDNATCTTCDEDNNNCTKCKNGYYLSNVSICAQCSYTCKNCTSAGICISCASEDCDLCPNNYTIGTGQTVDCTECIDGFYLYGNGQCFRCLKLGCTCDDASECNTCLPGWYGDKCELRCSDHCNTCSNLVCTECAPGFYGIACELPCSSECKDSVCNKDNGSCTEGCNTGKYGSMCHHNCSTLCLDNICDVTSGICTHGCADGYYLGVHSCYECSENCTNCTLERNCSDCIENFYLNQRKCYACPDRCKTCSDFENCLACKQHYNWGQKCQYDCVGCYSDCNQTSGCNSNCDRKYYRNYNSGKGGYECTGCPKSCESCTNGSLCNVCKPEYWGSVCQTKCDGCAASECHKDTGCMKCLDGHSLLKSDAGWFCIRCPDNCEKCLSNTTCQRCKDGFYSLNETCFNCSANCKDSEVCDSQSGACSGGCINGWRGEKCDMKCSTACAACEQTRSDICSTCHQGYFGNKCEYNCSAHCVVKGETQICEKETGKCTHGCQNSFCGYECTKKCSFGCKGSACNATNGFCVDGCIGNFYGISCNETCGENCQLLGTNSSERRCDSESGHCLYSCKIGWHGTFCSNTCEGHCKGSVCNQNDGKCSFGCAEGYTGDNCDQEQVSGAASPKEEGNSAPIIGATVGAGAVLVFAGIIVALVLRRRGGQDTSSKQSLSIEATTSETVEEPAYSLIVKERSSVKTAPNTSLKDTSPNYNTDAVINRACSYTPKYVERDSRFSKHSRDEGAFQVNREEEMLEETEFAGKSDPNTYYNTAGRRVRLNKLADYVQQKGVQDIEIEFHKLPKGLSTEKEYTVARRHNNILKNRYKFIYPYDESRVVLKDGRHDYINASYIEGFNRAQEYIGAMGPFEKGDVDIVPDFWRMIWQERCETIVMLTNLVENKQTKCKQYWPDPGRSETYGGLLVTCTTEDLYADFIVRTFTVTKDEEMLRVRHLHFTAWPDKSVPDDVTCLIEFRQKVRSFHKEKTSPMLVHCSAGIGRTGTFIALDILTFEGEARGYVDIFGCVATIRSNRVNLVQTPEQYVYLHHSVVHSLTFNCQSIQGDMFIENYRTLTEKTSGTTAMAKQYEKLQSSFSQLSSEETSLIQNKTLANKIRKGADFPGDDHRVILRENRKPGASDFINAIFLNGFRMRNKFIAAQTPLPATVVDFLSMVIEEKCCCIVMMDEPSLKDKTVGVYWPADNQVIKHGVFQVSCVESESSLNHTEKRLVITYHGQDKEYTKDVHLFMFTAWPKENVTPKTPESLLELIKAVDFRARDSANKGPIIVHCMTGSQRSCLYCAVSVLIEKMEIEHEVSVVNTLRQIKARRRSAVPTLEQYKFCHQAVVSYLQSFDIYSNFGLRSSQAATV